MVKRTAKSLSHPTVMKPIKLTLRPFPMPIKPNLDGKNHGKKLFTKQIAFRSKGCNLGEKYNVGLRLANAATAINTNEPETSDASGADLTMSTFCICGPLEHLSADSASVIHCFSVTLKE